MNSDGWSSFLIFLITFPIEIAISSGPNVAHVPAPPSPAPRHPARPRDS